MQQSADVFLLETNQSQETFIRARLGEYVSARLLSIRSQEALAQDLLNQDYACLLSRGGATSLSFCVCDGVGSSYRGDFAAHYLAGQLLTWLKEMEEIPPNLHLFSSTLHGLLDLWAYDAQMKVRQLAIPPETPQLAHEVLEELRETYGSETVFLCGRIDTGGWPSHARTTRNTLSTHPIRIVLCWMGNVTTRLSLSSDCCIVLGDQVDDQNRWSTVHGRRGEVTIWSDTLASIEHLTIHTDGLNTLSERLPALTDGEWQAKTRSLLHTPKNDDMTALEFRWTQQ